MPHTYARKNVRIYDRFKCQKECQKIRQIHMPEKCQKICQIHMPEKIKRYARYICQKECQMICQIICLWSLGCKRVVISPSSLLESLAKQCQNICQIKCIKNVRIYVKQTALVGIIRSKGKHFFCTVLYIYFEHLDVFLAAEVAPGIAPYPRSRRSSDPPGALGPRAAQSGRSSPIPPAQRGDPP